MRSFLTLSTLCFGASIQAQVMLDLATDTPQPGESFLYHAMPYTDIDGFQNAVTWDYSGLSGGATGTLNILAPGSTAQGASFPGTSYVEQWPNGELRYYSANNAGLWHHGTVSGPTTIVYETTGEARRMKFPLYFTDQWTNTVIANYTVGATPYYHYGNVYGSVPGSGTLVMPYGSYFPTMKIKYIEVFADFGPDTVEHTVTTIGFYHSGIHAPLVYSKTDVARNWNGDILSSSEEMYWLDGASVGMGEMTSGAHHATLFPNPATNSTWLALAPSRTGPVEVMLLDAIGRTVVRFPRSAAVPLQELSLAGVAPGAYHVVITDEHGSRSTLPLVVE